MKKYDAILYIEDDNCILESDERIYAKDAPKTTKGFKVSADWDDPKLYNHFSFGNLLKTNLDGMGKNFSNKIVDFKKWVTVEVTHHDIITGRSASKTFLIVFKEKGNGIVLSTHNRYRSISGVDQAASYIRAACGSLQSSTQTKIG